LFRLAGDLADAMAQNRMKGNLKTVERGGIKGTGDARTRP
jgi:hypothetical protein